MSMPSAFCEKILVSLLMLWRDERGASAIEYAVIAALIAAALVGFLEPVQEALKAVFDGLATSMGDAA
ncbi:Flp family type IVb pilin [Guyparkeria hydrothermalis]|uniref:Flp family type IVb pilin n=1 Tax=Guyparkeria hydrothermalis TaxID=923 RepID=UPI0020203AEE|nr:Flp family type IVb pilin [Guyparkeria hydrothermalis]MCL7743701.1 Flp family type IVb pilin [Guyparkeria hydrothermalis]